MADFLEWEKKVLDNNEELKEFDTGFFIPKLTNRLNHPRSSLPLETSLCDCTTDPLTNSLLVCPRNDVQDAEWYKPNNNRTPQGIKFFLQDKSSFNTKPVLEKFLKQPLPVGNRWSTPAYYPLTTST